MTEHGTGKAGQGLTSAKIYQRQDDLLSTCSKVTELGTPRDPLADHAQPHTDLGHTIALTVRCYGRTIARLAIGTFATHIALTRPKETMAVAPMLRGPMDILEGKHSMGNLDRWYEAGIWFSRDLSMGAAASTNPRSQSQLRLRREY
jgi:hypothetical protein